MLTMTFGVASAPTNSAPWRDLSCINLRTWRVSSGENECNAIRRRKSLIGCWGKKKRQFENCPKRHSQHQQHHHHNSRYKRPLKRCNSNNGHHHQRLFSRFSDGVFYLSKNRAHIICRTNFQRLISIVNSDFNKTPLFSQHPFFHYQPPPQPPKPKKVRKRTKLVVPGPLLGPINEADYHQTPFYHHGNGFIINLIIEKKFQISC